MIMSVVSTSEIKLTKTEAGVIRIGNTRVSLDSVLIAFNQGSTPEQIVYDYDSLSLAEVYAAISYYLQHREEVDSYLAERAKQNKKLCDSNIARFGHKGIREKLLSRLNNTYTNKVANGRFQILRSVGETFGFNLIAANGEIILTSEVYESKAAALNGIESVKRNAANPRSFKYKTSGQGEAYFVLAASNGQIIGRSEMYSSTSAAENGIESVRQNASTSQIEDLT